jgi:1,4-dihydroxy-2-naphthoyl-CoA hydrolase
MTPKVDAQAAFTGESRIPDDETLDATLGFRFLGATEDTAAAEVPYAHRVSQRFGVAHGGLYAALAEMVASEGTIHNVWANGDYAMGSSNTTSFMRPVSSGTIHANARARHRGRTTWVWDIDLTDDDGRLCATSRVTMAVRPRPTQ